MLFRNPRGYVTTSEYVEFYMDDPGRPKTVTCRVSREALDERAARDRLVRDELLQDRFEAFRAEIEQLAADKFARGIVEPNGHVLIGSADLN
jgi:hypothetical protein